MSKVLLRAYEVIKGMLCDPEGSVSVSSSEADRRVLQESLDLIGLLLNCCVDEESIYDSLNNLFNRVDAEILRISPKP